MHESSKMFKISHPRLHAKWIDQKCIAFNWLEWMESCIQHVYNLFFFMPSKFVCGFVWNISLSLSLRLFPYHFDQLSIPSFSFFFLAQILSMDNSQYIHISHLHLKLQLKIGKSWFICCRIMHVRVCVHHIIVHILRLYNIIMIKWIITVMMML